MDPLYQVRSQGTQMKASSWFLVFSSCVQGTQMKAIKASSWFLQALGRFHRVLMLGQTPNKENAGPDGSLVPTHQPLFACSTHSRCSTPVPLHVGPISPPGPLTVHVLGATLQAPAGSGGHLGLDRRQVDHRGGEERASFPLLPPASSALLPASGRMFTGALLSMVGIGPRTPPKSTSCSSLFSTVPSSCVPGANRDTVL